MNTINPIRPYVSMKNEPQVPVTQPTAPAFKGQLGQKVVQEITAKKAVTVASILALVGGMIGLNKDKVADVMESLVEKIQNLISKNDSLDRKLEDANKEIEKIKGEKEKIRQDGMTSLENSNRIIRAKEEEIEGQKARIRELQAYAAMAKVKSVDEIDTVMPEEALAIIEEIKANDEAAHKSLFEYVMTGKGQEEFLKQMERNQILAKARADEISEIPEVKKALKDASPGTRGLGYDSYSVACYMLEHCLAANPKGRYLASKTIFDQVKTNAVALILPMQDKRYSYMDSPLKAINKAAEFHKNLAAATEVIAKKGRKFVSDTIVENSLTQSYRTFKDEEGRLWDYPLSRLALEHWGCTRVRTPEGEIIHDNAGLKK